MPLRRSPAAYAPHPVILRLDNELVRIAIQWPNDGELIPLAWLVMPLYTFCRPKGVHVPRPVGTDESARLFDPVGKGFDGLQGIAADGVGLGA